MIGDKNTFRLVMSFVHCLGRRDYTAGYVDTHDEAREWVEAMSLQKTFKPPAEDPLVWCPVHGCPGKITAPTYRYEEVQEGNAD